MMRAMEPRLISRMAYAAMAFINATPKVTAPINKATAPGKAKK
jgi:hypothetical protein